MVHKIYKGCSDSATNAEKRFKNYMHSEISVKVFRSCRKLVGPAETDIV
jgi:hypothetical protein